MLFLYYDKNSIKDHLVKDIDALFAEVKEDLWFYSKFTQEVVTKIEHSTLYPPKKVYHRLFGDTTVDNLTKYSKLFILLRFYNKAVYEASLLHPDFAYLIKDISDIVDVHLYVNDYIPYVDSQEACLPEYSCKLNGGNLLHEVYKRYLLSPVKVKDMLT